MSKFALLLIFIKAFFRTWKSTFNQMTVEELNHVYEKEITTNQFNKSYYLELYHILVRQRVDAVLDNSLLEQITGQLYMPNATTAYAWLARFREYVSIYITKPELHNSSEWYIPMELKNYFITSNASTSNLEYLVQDNGTCAILPFIEDIIDMLDELHNLINSIDDEITRYYYIDQLKLYHKDIHKFMIRTIDWINTYDRTR
jgi:hypothetical protein